MEQDEDGKTRRRAVFAADDADGMDEDDEDDDDEDDDDEDADMDGDEDMDDDDMEDEEDDAVDDEHIPVRGHALSKFDTRNIPRKGEKDNDDDQDHENELHFAESDSDLGGDDDEDMINVDGRMKHDDEEEELAGELRWKANLKQKASEMFFEHRRVNLMNLIYGDSGLSPEDIASGNYEKQGNESDEEEHTNDDEDEEFFKLKRESTEKNAEPVDSARETFKENELEIWDDEEVVAFPLWGLFSLLVRKMLVLTFGLPGA